jgi:c-di-GMP-binding flagellar brake protein YcgR
MSSSPEEKTLEQREYFRIDDVAIVQYRVVPDDEYRNLGGVVAGISDKLTLKAKFDCMSRQLQPLYRTIVSSHPDLARYLSAIDQKLNMLTEQLVQDELDEVGNKPQHVNIGAGGMSFSTELPVKTGAMLELRLVLLPETTGVFTYASVVSCARNQANESVNGDYKVAVYFENMSDEVRDIISRHVLTREQASIRKLRGE